MAAMHHQFIMNHMPLRCSGNRGPSVLMRTRVWRSSIRMQIVFLYLSSDFRLINRSNVFDNIELLFQFII